MGSSVNAIRSDTSKSATVEEKESARQKLKASLKAVHSDNLAVQSKSICQNVMSLPAFKQARTVVAYLSCPKLREVDTEDLIFELLKRGVRVYVPVVKDNDSNMQMLHLDSISAVREVPPFGIKEPIPTYADGSARAELLQAGHMPDVVLVPGLGFDRAGRRLGRGGGYYDKFLSALAAKSEADGTNKPLQMGLSFKQQLMDYVPVHQHDHTIDLIVTPDQVLWVGSV